MTNNNSNVIENLKEFKELSTDHKKHSNLIKDKKVILYAATLLDNDNITILSLCLDILENFVADEQTHAFLMSTFGIYEAIETLAMRMRNKNEKIYNKAIEITEILRNSTPPAYNTRSRVRGCKQTKKQQLFLLFIEDLNAENLPKLEHALLKIRGIISFLIDMELRRCTIRICPKITVKEVIEKIYAKATLRALVVTKNVQKGTEDYYDIMENTMNKSYLEYSDEDTCPKEKTVAAFPINMVRNGNNLLKSAVNFWKESFYW